MARTGSPCGTAPAGGARLERVGSGLSPVAKARENGSGPGQDGCRLPSAHVPTGTAQGSSRTLVSPAAWLSGWMLSIVRIVPLRERITMERVRTAPRR